MTLADIPTEAPDSEPPEFPPTHETPRDLREPIVDAQGTRTYTDVEFAAVVGYRPLRMDLMIPASDGPVPVVVYIHGGAFRFGSRHRNRVGGPVWDSLLSQGIAVAAVEYRLSGEAAFPACVRDVKAAVRWLRAYGAELGLRPDSIGSWGESAGGHLSAFLGLNSTDPELVGAEGVVGVSSDVVAAVCWYPPTDFLRMDEQAPANARMAHDAQDSPESLLVRGALQENRDAATFASPITHVSASAAPMLLMHGADDREVPHPQSITFAAALDEAGASVELELVPGAEHVFDGVDRAPLIARSTAFLAAHLR